MVDDIQRNKYIEQLRNNLRAVGSAPPQIDMFCRAGRIAWDEWAETCRDLECELKDAGVVF